jgi:hypothetical protein
MSTNPIATGAVGPMTRAQRAAASGVNPTPPSHGAPSTVGPSIPVLPPLSASPVTVISPDSGAFSEVEEKLYDSDTTESEIIELPRLSELDEEARLRLEESQLNIRIHQLQMFALQQRVTAKARTFLALQAEVDALASGGDPSPALIAGGPTTPAVVAPVVVTQAVSETPARYNLRPRMLAFQSTVGRKPPTAAALLYKAGVDGLPDRVPAVGNSLRRLDEVKSVVPPVTVTVLEVPPPATSTSASKSESHSKPNYKPVQPVMFTGDDATQNERVERWILAVDSWLRLSKIPVDDHLEYARSLFSTSGTANLWLGQKDDELEASNKEMTWDWLKGQVIQHYGSPSGALAMAAEWQSLRMGVKNVDGSETGGKSTWTVMAYTALFLHYMRALTVHSVQTTDILVIDRYVAGIKAGYEALYKVMLGVQRVLWFDSLKEAIDAAEVAEVTLTVSRIDKRAERSSAAASSPPGTGTGRGYRGRRQPTQALNNVEGSPQSGTEVAATATAPAAPAEPVRMYGFRYQGPGPNDGRHPLTESQAKMLYEEHRCYRCHEVHPLGTGTPRCTKAPAKTAPRPLN